MKQPPKKYKRPDTPLATTPEPSLYDKSQAVIDLRNKINTQKEEQSKKTKEVVYNQIDKLNKSLDSIKKVQMDKRMNQVEGSQSR
jgi:hypothetical protein